MSGESKWSEAYFQYISIALNLPCNKNKLYKTSDYQFKDMLHFNFSGKGLWLVSPPHVWFFKENVFHETFY